MTDRKTYLPGRLLLVAMLLAVTGKDASAEPSLRFVDATEQAGLLVYSPSFAVVATDIDGDLRDDLFIGNHGFPPNLFLNRGGLFEPANHLVPITRRDDRHGYTLVDLDNDGDRDMVYAGGGADGIGKGSDNRLYRNNLVETGEPAFTEDPAGEALAFRTWRSRQFLPLANPAGDAVDLYLTSLHRNRKGSTNLYFRNDSDMQAMRFTLDEPSSLNRRFESNGMDRFVDIDRDGDVDFIRVGMNRASLYLNMDGRFLHKASALDFLFGVQSLAIADFNNDGLPDLYLGGFSGRTGSDAVVANADEIHFVIERQPDDAGEGVSFSAADTPLSFNLVEHLPEVGRNRTDASDIFIGAAATHPTKRRFLLTAGQASGEPAAFAAPGTYIWHTAGTWHVRWHHGGNGAGAKGIIAGSEIELVGIDGLEEYAPRAVRDFLIENRGHGNLAILEADALAHDQWTTDVTAADFNNDGLVDIAGIRARDYGQANGDAFLMLNRGGMTFTRTSPFGGEVDNIFRSDLIVHGFFNEDGLPDLFYTNGGGLLPSHHGPYQLWLNASDADNGYALLSLEGGVSNRDAIGAQVELYDGDELIGYREIGPGYGRAQDTHTLHFGLGRREGPFEARIRWPGADDFERVPVPANRLTRVRQSGG